MEELSVKKKGGGNEDILHYKTLIIYGEGFTYVNCIFSRKTVPFFNSFTYIIIWGVYLKQCND